MASVNKDDLFRLYITEMKSIPDIAEILSVSRSAARKMILECGITLRTRAEGIRASKHKLGVHLIGKTRIFSEECKAKLSKAKIARGDLLAAGVSHKTGGYSEITRGPNKGRGVHVVIKEEEIGRKLFPHEVVHHIDGNKQNNDPSNLLLMTRSDHARHHINEQIRRKQHGIS